MNKTLLSSILILALAGAVFFLINKPQTPATASTPEEALTVYFWLLSEGAYDEALAYHGSGFETLTDWNPDMPASDYASLMKNGCETNGWNCLPIKTILKTQELSTEEVVFTVEFIAKDGSRFEQGPCCGATEGPIKTSFDYTVKNINDKWLVMTPPPYTP